MIFGRTLVLSLATLLVAAPTVFAAQQTSEQAATQQKELRQSIEDEATDPARPGPMFGLGAGYALNNFHNIGQDPDNSGAYNAHIGYRFNPRFATELQIERYQEFDLPGGDVNGWAVGLNAKGYMLTGRYQPWALIGLNFLDMETTNSAAANPRKTDDGAAMRFGFGLDVYATTKIAVVTDISYVLGMGQVKDYDVVMFSLGFLFRP
jgi:hypothetical protein